MSKLRIALIAVAFVVVFVGAYQALRLMPQWGEKLQTHTAGLVPPAEVFRGTPEALPDREGRGATRDLSKIVESYRREADHPKATALGASDVAQTSGGASSQPVRAAAVRTPPPTLKVIREWPTGRKCVALTFDDGPHPEFTRRFLALLAEKNVKATFFLLGPNAEKWPDIVREIVEAGHEVANHSWNHPVLNKLTPEKIRSELERTNEAIAAASGVRPRLMRPPYGSVNKKVEDVADELGLRIMCWSIDTDDWRKTTTKEKMVETVKKNARDGAIILMHDRFEKSYETTREVIDALRAEGYEFVTVGELLGMAPQTREAGAAAVAKGLATPAPPSVVSQASASVIASPTPRPQLDVPASMPAASAATSGSGADLPAVAPEKITRPPAAGSRARP